MAPLGDGDFALAQAIGLGLTIAPRGTQTRGSRSEGEREVGDQTGAETQALRSSDRQEGAAHPARGLVGLSPVMRPSLCLICLQLVSVTCDQDPGPYSRTDSGK